MATPLEVLKANKLANQQKLSSMLQSQGGYGDRIGRGLVGLAGAAAGAFTDPDVKAYEEFQQAQPARQAAQERNANVEQGGGAFGLSQSVGGQTLQENPQAVDRYLAQQNQGLMANMSPDMRPAASNQQAMQEASFTQEGMMEMARKRYQSGDVEGANQALAYAKALESNVKEGFSLKKDEIQYDADGNIIAQNTPKENDVLTAKDRYKTVGGALYDLQNETWLSPPKNKADINTTPIKMLNDKGENVTRLVREDGTTVAEFLAPKDSGGMSSALEKDQMASLTASNEALTTDRRVSQTIAGLESMPDFGGGLPLSFEDVIKDNAGWRDVKSAILTEARGFRAENAMRYLPPGPASDKDVALALSGQPPESASRAEWLGYLKGIQKLSRLEANYYRDRDSFISNNGDLRGFGQQQEAKRIDTAILNLPSKGDGTTPLTIYNAVPNNTPEKAKIKKDFIDKYGFDPDRRAELQSALTNLGL
jgi:hypothetical protein